MFLNAYPVVEVNPYGNVESLQQQNMSCIEIEGHFTIQKFSELGKDIKIKMEVLTRQKLMNVRDNGCRILVISSNIDDYDGKLCIENQQGEVERISPKDLQAIL